MRLLQRDGPGRRGALSCSVGLQVRVTGRGRGHDRLSSLTTVTRSGRIRWLSGHATAGPDGISSFGRSFAGERYGLDHSEGGWP